MMLALLPTDLSLSHSESETRLDPCSEIASSPTIDDMASAPNVIPEVVAIVNAFDGRYAPFAPQTTEGLRQSKRLA
jgi:hypothetical protein